MCWCLPMIMCGPLASTPPDGTMTVSAPRLIASRTSIQVMSAISTVAGAGAVSGRDTTASAPTAVPRTTRPMRKARVWRTDMGRGRRKDPRAG